MQRLERHVTVWSMTRISSALTLRAWAASNQLTKLGELREGSLLHESAARDRDDLRKLAIGASHRTAGAPLRIWTSTSRHRVTRSRSDWERQANRLIIPDSLSMCRWPNQHRQIFSDPRARQAMPIRGSFAESMKTHALMIWKQTILAPCCPLRCAERARRRRRLLRHRQRRRQPRDPLRIRRAHRQTVAEHRASR
jgi:hypothetical protein